MAYDHYQCIDQGLCSGHVPATAFRLAPSQDGETPSAMHAWLEEAQTDSPINQVPDVVIETGVFKVRPVNHECICLRILQCVLASV